MDFNDIAKTSDGKFLANIYRWEPNFPRAAIYSGNPVLLSSIEVSRIPGDTIRKT
jgi:hypothetical protein